MKLILTIAILAIALPCFAELTDTEEIQVRELLAKKAKILDLAETKTQALLPLEIKKLEAQRDDLIAERDGKLRAEDVKCKALQKTIEGTYETLIDGVESNISVKRNAIIQ